MSRFRIRVVLAVIALVPMIVASLAMYSLAQAASQEERAAQQSALDLDAFIALRDVQTAVDGEMYLYVGWTEFASSLETSLIPASAVNDLLGQTLANTSDRSIADARSAAISQTQLDAIDQTEDGIMLARSSFLATDLDNLYAGGQNVTDGYDALGLAADAILERHDYSWVAIQEQSTFPALLAREIYGLATLSLSPSIESERQLVAIDSARAELAYQDFLDTLSAPDQARMEAALAESQLETLRKLLTQPTIPEMTNVFSIVEAVGSFDPFLLEGNLMRQQYAEELRTEAFATADAANERYTGFLIGAIGILVGPALLVLFIGGSLSRRLERVASAAHSLANGELDVQVEDVSGRDEVAVVGRAFNDVAATVAMSHTQIGILADGRYDDEVLNQELPGAIGKTLRLALRRLSNSAAELAHHASHDRLTGLLDRRGISQRMQMLPRASGSVAMIDLDGFKTVNDTYGHEAGDAVLLTVARRLQAHCRDLDGDLVGRLGGDEFIVVTTLNQPAELESFMNRLVDVIDQPIPWNGIDLTVSASVGYTPHTFSEDYEVALKRADAAMYRAKHAGKARSVFAPAGV